MSPERPVDPAPVPGEEPSRPPQPRPQPRALELLRWSAILFGISLLVAAVAIPLLRWLGFGG